VIVAPTWKQTRLSEARRDCLALEDTSHRVAVLKVKAHTVVESLARCMWHYVLSVLHFMSDGPSVDRLVCAFCKETIVSSVG